MEHKVIKRTDYEKPLFLIPTIDLVFDLHDSKTIVTAVLEIKRNGNHNKPLKLEYSKLRLMFVELNENKLPVSQYTFTEEHLIIYDVPNNFILKTISETNPTENLALEGLYKSGGIFCTQNEPEGFRQITFFIDRPDVLSIFKVKIIADKKQANALLSNGNCIESGELENGRHYAVWFDPFPKPSYLFALVAGNLGMVSDKYITSSGREVDCRIYCDPGNEDRCHYALASLIKAMRWDEKRFGLEYDLDIYMIVAVDSFNMGAMENKGLNIFNSKYVLASSTTATDDDFLAIESVVGHEYFHNWTGNRVTLRDWFQLTLKEGLTVFRDQEFTSDEQSRSVKRIVDASDMLSIQFIEDAGPNAHAIRPESYMEINNFYTVTVYEKGAEICRMIHTILGEENFQKGMKRYFELFDGMAVTCEDFIETMEAASGADLAQFRLWYSQSGTPNVLVQTHYNNESQKFYITLKQTIPDTPGQTGKLPMHIPLLTGLVNNKGADIELDAEGNTSVLLHLKENEQEFVFDNISSMPYLSINRNFSAPVIITHERSMDEKIFLFANDSDTFNRWDAGQSAAKHIAKQYVEALQKEKNCVMDKGFVYACRALINSKTDDSFKALAMLLPSENLLIQEYDVIDFDAISLARKTLKQELALELETDLLLQYKLLNENKKIFTEESFAPKRKFILRVLDYLAASGKPEYIELCKRLYFENENMTMKAGILSILSDHAEGAAAPAFEDFYNTWKNDRNVIMKWFAVQSGAAVTNCLENVLKLEKNPVYDIHVPNLVRVVTGAFGQNMVCFHEKSGRGYTYMADRLIQIDAFNPSISSSLARSFKMFAKCDDVRKQLMKREMERILAVEGLSKNAREIVQNTLNY